MNDAEVTQSPYSVAHVMAKADAEMRRGAFSEAAETWRELRTLQPDRSTGFVGEAAALLALMRFDDAETLVDAGLASFADDVALISARAKVSTAKGEWSLAERRWLALLDVAPAQAGALAGLVQALVAQGKFAEAEARVEKAYQTDPTNLELLTARADIATRTRNWKLAEQCWRAVHRQFPERQQPIVNLANALIQQKSYPEATALLDAAAAAEPNAGGIAEARARLAVAQADWKAAERVWLDVVERFPLNPLAWHGVVQSRMKAGDLAGAEDFSGKAVARFSSNPIILSIHASISMAKGDWPEAECRWEQLRSIAPDNPSAWIHQATACRAQGRLTESAALLADAHRRFPDDPGIGRHCADAAEASGNWAEASEILHRLVAATPSDQRLQQRAFEASWRNVGAPDPLTSVASLRASHAPSGNANRDLMLRFESLGDDAEFAMVQRHFGAEPITLFRWAEAGTEELTAALNDDLTGVGEAQFVNLTLNGDYKVRDKIHGFTLHTWIKEEQSDLEKFFLAQCKRTQFLRRKLLEDLKDGEKLFVFKSALSEPMSEVRRLHTAIRLHGPATLLYVGLANDERPTGTVEEVAPGLLVAYLSQLTGPHMPPVIAYDEWCELLRKSLALAGGAHAQAATQQELQDLLLRFESLGDNCELGWVQRRRGAEPLGLLRWTSTSLSAVANAIETNFSGVGDPANTELLLADDYRAVDARYGFNFRTYMRADRVDSGVALAEQCRRMRLLSEMLLHDLRAGQKILVHKTARPPPLSSVMALHGAVRRHGRANLLHTRPADPENPNGKLEELAPGLFIGYLDRLFVTGGGWGIDHSSWQALCYSVVERL